MTNEDFLKEANQNFWGKIHIADLSTITYKDARKLGYKRSSLCNYPPQAWIPITEENGQKHYRCHVCNTPLGGLFGSFSWGIGHGVGWCSQCKRAKFQLYHYVEKNKRPLELFALCGF